MRVSYILIIFLILFACKESAELKMKVTTLKTRLTAENNDYLKYYHPERIGQEMEIVFIKNRRNSKDYGIMSCSYDKDFVLDNKDFRFQIFQCDANYPTNIEFVNNKSEKYHLFVTKAPDSKSEYFKIGFKKIIVPNDFNLIDSYIKQFDDKKYEILWSEPIKFE